MFNDNWSEIPEDHAIAAAFLNSKRVTCVSAWKLNSIQKANTTAIRIYVTNWNTEKDGMLHRLHWPPTKNET
jgi:hypothetical protein